MRIISPMRGDKLALGDGLATTMPVVATMDPQGRRFALNVQALNVGDAIAYNAIVYVPFDVPGFVKPDYSNERVFKPWAQLAVQVDPSDMQVKLYMGAWSGDGQEVHSLCVFRSGLYFVP